MKTHGNPQPLLVIIRKHSSRYHDLYLMLATYVLVATNINDTSLSQSMSPHPRSACECRRPHLRLTQRPNPRSGNSSTATFSRELDITTVSLASPSIPNEQVPLRPKPRLVGHSPLSPSDPKASGVAALPAGLTFPSDESLDGPSKLDS